MKKVSLQEKNANPKIYGYGSLEDLNQAAPHYDGDTLLEFAISFKDADRHLRYIPCTKEYLSFHRGLIRDEKRAIEIESRCNIPSDFFVENGVFVRRPDKNPRVGYKKCMHDCNHCPFEYNPNNPNDTTYYKRTGNPMSLNIELEDSDGNTIELLDKLVDTDNLNPEEKYILKKQNEELELAISKLDSNEQLIIKLSREGYSDSEIGRKLVIPRSTIQEKRKKIINKLKKS